MNDSAKIIQRFLASLDPGDVNAAQAFLLGFFVQAADAETASAAVRWARQTLDLSHAQLAG